MSNYLIFDYDIFKIKIYKIKLFLKFLLKIYFKIKRKMAIF